MTMQDVVQFLRKNRFFYQADIAGKTINSIETRAYPPNNDFRVPFFSWQSDDDRRREVETIVSTHRRRGRELKR